MIPPLLGSLVGTPGRNRPVGAFVMSKYCWRAAIAVLLGTTATVAVAADLPPQAAPPATAPAMYNPAPANQWTVTLGIEGRIVPAWPGAETGFDNKKAGLSALPLISVRKAGTPPTFFGPRDGFGISIIDLAQFKLGPVGKIVWKRTASDYAEINGLTDVNYALQVGGFAEFWAVPWLRLRAEVRKGFGGETGVTGDVFLDAVVPIGQLTLSGGPRMTVQSDKAVSPYFSISSAEATAANSAQPTLAPLTAYTAGGGIYSYGAGAQARYFWSPQWATHVFVEYERLVGDAANSPLVVQRGSPNQFTYGAGVTYSFDTPGFW
jgi:outer membrane protein